MLPKRLENETFDAYLDRIDPEELQKAINKACEDLDLNFYTKYLAFLKQCQS